MATAVHEGATAKPLAASVARRPVASGPPSRATRTLPAPHGGGRRRAADADSGLPVAARRLARAVIWIGAEIANAIVAEVRIRRDMRHLAAMSDNMLRDIGLRRADIRSAVRYGRD